MGRQRGSYLKGKLSDDRIKLLEEIGFVWDILESQWEEMFEALKEYKNNHDHCNVPATWTENQQLGYWVTVQRRSYKDETLSEDHIKRLEDIGFVWNPLESQWEEMFEALKEYKKKYGDVNVKQKGTENKHLGTWVSAQRKGYNSNLLSEDRIKRLEDIGFVWNIHKR